MCGGYLLLLLSAALIGATSCTKWRCSGQPGEEYSFPLLEESDINSSLWQDSQLGVSYVYPVPSASRNCSGTVTAIQFCYRLQQLPQDGTTLHVFTLGILVQNANAAGYEESDSIDVRSTPPPGMRAQSNGNNTFCYSLENSRFCCDLFHLNNSLSFVFPKGNFAIAISTPSSSMARLQMYRNQTDSQEYEVSSSFITDSSLLDQGGLTPSDASTTPLTFQAVKLLIDATITPTKTTTTSLTSNDVSSVFIATSIQEISRQSSSDQLLPVSPSSSEAASMTVGIYSSTIISDSPSATTLLEVPTSSPPSPFPTAFSQTILPNSTNATRWACVEDFVDTDAIGYTFPALQQQDLMFQAWENTEPGARYLYPVFPDQIGCSGVVTGVRFCYRVSPSTFSNELVFILHIVNRTSNEIIQSIEFYSTPVNDSISSTSVMCGELNELKYCCDTKDLSDNSTITFPPDDFILGMTTSNSSSVQLQLLRSDLSSQGIYHVFTSSSWSQANAQGQMLIINSTIPAVRFDIRNLINPKSTSTSQEDITGATSTPYMNVTTIFSRTESSSAALSPTPHVTATNTLPPHTPTDSPEEMSTPPQSSTTNASDFWMCSINDRFEDIEEYSFPDLREVDLNPSLWQDSEAGVSYVYSVAPELVGCSGNITGLYFCYKVLDRNLSNIHVFTLHIINNTDGSIIESVSIQTSPLRFNSSSSSGQNSSRCMSFDNQLYCCEYRNFSSAGRVIQFPVMNFTFVISTADTSIVTLQKYSSVDLYRPTFMAPTFMSISGEETLSNSMRVYNSTSQAVRLNIRNLINPKGTSASQEDITGATSTPYMNVTTIISRTESSSVALSPTPHVTATNTLPPHSPTDSPEEMSTPPQSSTTNASDFWMCSINDRFEDIEEFSFPDLREVDLNPSLWQDSEAGVSYVYSVAPELVGCSGSITGLHFCYKVLDRNLSNIHVFTLHIINNTDGSIIESVSIQTSPLHSNSSSSSGLNSSRCMSFNNQLYCCEYRNFSSAWRVIQFPVMNFTLGISTADTSMINLQKYSSVDLYRPTFMAPTFMSISGEVTISHSMIVYNSTSQVVRLNIRKQRSFRDTSTSILLSSSRSLYNEATQIAPSVSLSSSTQTYLTYDLNSLTTATARQSRLSSLTTLTGHSASRTLTMKSEATSIISMSSITATVETTAQSTATTEVSDDTGNTNTVVVIIVGVLVVVVVAALLFVFFIAIYCVIRRRLNSNKNGTEGNSGGIGPPSFEEDPAAPALINMTYLTALPDHPQQPNNSSENPPSLILNLDNAENIANTEISVSSGDKASTKISDSEEACPDYNDVVSGEEQMVQLESVACEWVDTEVTDIYLSNGNDDNSPTENSDIDDCLKEDIM